MKIILLKDVKNIGRKFEVKNVADGFALNMLIPNKSAVPATPSNLKMIETKKKANQLEIAKNEAELNEALNQIKDIEVSMSGKVNDKGHLFAGIHKEEILTAIKSQKGINLNPDYLILDRPIKEIGDHAILVKVGNREVSFRLIINSI
jgi:large subunit ribosomal protein L9